MPRNWQIVQGAFDNMALFSVCHLKDSSGVGDYRNATFFK